MTHATCLVSRRNLKDRLRAKIPFVHLHEANKHSVSKGDTKTILCTCTKQTNTTSSQQGRYSTVYSRYLTSVLKGDTKTEGKNRCIVRQRICTCGLNNCTVSEMEKHI